LLATAPANCSIGHLFSFGGLLWVPANVDWFIAGNGACVPWSTSSWWSAGQISSVFELQLVSITSVVYQARAIGQGAFYSIKEPFWCSAVSIATHALLSLIVGRILWRSECIHEPWALSYQMLLLPWWTHWGHNYFLACFSCLISFQKGMLQYTYCWTRD
jgi:hypothetical protein